MLEIAVVGEPEFTMGFRFAGIRNVKDVGEGAAEESLRQVLKEEGVGILITSQRMMDACSAEMRHTLNSSFSPVAVVVSGKDEMGSLREAIKKAIGVDLWK